MESTRTVKEVIAIDYRQPGWPADHWTLWEEVKVWSPTEPNGYSGENLKAQIEREITELTGENGWGDDVAHRLRRVKVITISEPYEL